MSDLEHFARNVLRYLRREDWKVEWVPNSGEGYCWMTGKRITIGLDCPDLKELFLHEAAHIDTCRFTNQKHTPAFWKRFDDLRLRFLKGVPESDGSKRMRKWMSDGIVGLCYADDERARALGFSYMNVKEPEGMK